MQKFNKFWEFLNGKKTIIGSMIMIIAAFYTDVLVGFWSIHGSWVIPLSKTLNWFGVAFSATGIIHKYVKYKAE